MFNTVFALFEILCTNSPPAPWITLPFGILFLAMYLGVAYITHATLGIYSMFFISIEAIPLIPVFPAYSFLNPATQGATLAAYICGIPIGYTIIFILVRGIAVLRERWAVKNGHVLRTGGGGAEVRPTIDDDWEEVESPVRAKGDV